MGITLRPCVQAFAERMETKLSANDHKGGWSHMAKEDLVRLLIDEFYELVVADAENVADEAADVANFAMMIADVVRLRAEKGK